MINQYNTKVGKPQNVKSKTMWEHIFEEKDIKDRVVAVYKNGQLLKRGVIEGWAPPQLTIKELIVSYSSIV